MTQLVWGSLLRHYLRGAWAHCLLCNLQHTHISGHTPWNILQPITFYPWKLLPHSSPNSLPEIAFARVIWQWHNHSDCQLRKMFYIYQRSCSCKLVPFLAPWDLARSLSLGEDSSALHFLSSPVPTRPWLPPSSWHSHMPKSGCPTKHGSAPSWRVLVLQGWGEAAGIRASVVERQWNSWWWPASATPVALRVSSCTSVVPTGNTQGCSSTVQQRGEGPPSSGLHWGVGASPRSLWFLAS